jgi:aldehyde:ferredoxin oxidoreductase
MQHPTKHRDKQKNRGGEAEMLKGYAGKILRVNLSEQKTTRETLNTEMARKFIGGKGLFGKYLFDEVKAKTDPLSPENVLMIATGPLTGTLAPSNRAVVITKSPLTNTFLDSYFGGVFGQELKFAGYDGLIIEGKAEKKVYLWVDDDNAEILDAKHLNGMETGRTSMRIKDDLGDSTIKVGCIGPAGEKLVRFACIDFDIHRQAGRGGAGAVMGSKNLKAVAIRGTGNIEVADLVALKEAAKEAHLALKENPYTALGTAGSVGFANDQGYFPYKNFQDQTYRDADRLAGEAQSKRIWTRRRSCYSCPIRCTFVSVLKRGIHSGMVVDAIEYENAGMLGANCDISDTEDVAFSNYLCDELGLDAISAGNAVGFVMECFQKKLLTKNDVGFEVKFGDSKAQIELIKRIAERVGFGDILAEGVMRAARRIGHNTEDFAIHIRGLEMPAWAPRGSPGMGLALATADRGGCHQRSWPIAFELGAPTPYGDRLDRLALKGKPEIVKWEQDFLSTLYSLVECEFSRSKLNMEHYCKLLSATTGWEIAPAEFMRVGERIWNLTRLFNVREGFRRSDDSLPARFMNEPLPSGPAKGHRISLQDLNKMLNAYYSLRGWNELGIPSTDRLLQLGLNEMSKQIEMEV